jgi:hypothetical protein
MAIPTRINHTISRALAGIAERVLDDAHMTWLAAETDPEHALRVVRRERAAACGRVPRILRGGRPRAGSGQRPTAAV